MDASLLTRPVNVLTSGKTRTTSTQPSFINPNGAATSMIIEGATTNLIYDVNGTSSTISTDITVSGLTTAFAATNTCLIDDADAADQEETRTWGEYGSEKDTITVDTMGANFQTKVGEFIAFSINDGATDEYAIGFLKSITEITQVYRGFYVNSSLNPVNRLAFTDNDVITILNIGWVFAENNGTTIDVSYSNPSWSFVSPGSPATGDYWYDMSNNLWKRYSGSSFDIINRALIGQIILDDTNAIASRSFEFFKGWSEENTMDVEVSTTEIGKSTGPNQKINVNGVTIDFNYTDTAWNISTDLATAADMYNASEQVSTYYYLYLDENMEPFISDISPQYRADMAGNWVHPHNPWRCVAKLYNDSSSDFTNERNYFPFHKYNPNVEFPTKFAARIDNNGTATIFSQGEFIYIASVNRPGTGQVTNTWELGFFTDIPAVVVAIEAVNNRTITIGTPSTTGVDVFCELVTTGADSDHDFDMVVERQGNDSKDIF